MRYERTGEYRAPHVGEWFEVKGDGQPCKRSEPNWSFEFGHAWILREVPDECAPAGSVSIEAHLSLQKERDDLKRRLDVAIAANNQLHARLTEIKRVACRAEPSGHPPPA
jgi:hypothetical protein